MKEYIKSFCQEHDYPQEAAQTLSAAYEEVNAHICAASFHEWLNQYHAGQELNYKELFVILDEMAENTGIHKYTLHLLFFICLSRYAKERYAAQNLDLQIFHDSMADLRWKLFECHNIFGIWGSFVAFWFPGFFELTRFALGRLQFELVKFTETYECDGFRVNPGDMVINLHIPSCGPLRTEECMESFRRAATFFQESFTGDRTVFVCDSWLLYPSHRDFLPASSNILKFMDFFDIIASKEQGEQNDLWRIFNQIDCTDMDALPRDTSLRRTYVDWLKKGGRPGSGLGIFLWDDVRGVVNQRSSGKS